MCVNPCLARWSPSLAGRVSELSASMTHSAARAWVPLIACSLVRLLDEYDFFFFFQAEDGIRDDLVTGVQTCALPILMSSGCQLSARRNCCRELAAESNCHQRHSSSMSPSQNGSRELESSGPAAPPAGDTKTCITKKLAVAPLTVSIKLGCIAPPPPAYSLTRYETTSTVPAPRLF